MYINIGGGGEGGKQNKNLVLKEGWTLTRSSRYNHGTANQSKQEKPAPWTHRCRHYQPITFPRDRNSQLFHSLAHTIPSCTTNNRKMLSFYCYIALGLLFFVCVTGVSVCMSVLGTITHSMCIYHLAKKLYCIVLYCIVLPLTWLWYDLSLIHI